MGPAKKQTQDELREVVPRAQILLRQKYYPQNSWQAVREDTHKNLYSSLDRGRGGGLRYPCLFSS